MPADNRVQAQPGRYLDALRADVRAGLTATPKTLPPKYFYDARGSELFDEITRLPEYYLTRAETAILERHAADIAALSQCESLVELGSGTSAKTRLLLRALLDGGTLREFVPFDVDPAVLAEASEALSAEYPGLRIAPFLGDFTRDLGAIPATGRRTIAFIGSTIGNLEPAERATFLAQVGAALRPGDTFLLGHRPGQGHRPAAARLRRRGRGDGRVQPQRAAGHQPRAGRRLRGRGVRARRGLERRPRVDRDAAALGPRPAGHDPRPRT